MNDPGQYLVHLTSRGPKVFGDDGATGDFKCYTTQPMKDINKFGLLHYSIPKMLDHVQDNNRGFTIRLKFAHGTNVDVPVYLPLLDYNDMYVTNQYDRSRIGKKTTKMTAVSSRLKWKVMFDEVLQSTINWALMTAADGFYAQAVNTISQKMCARISCIVRHTTVTNTLNLTFGYRGTQSVVFGDDPTKQAFNNGVRTLSGCPFPTTDLVVVPAGNGTILANGSGIYARTGPNGDTRSDNPVFDLAYGPADIDQAVLTGVELRGLSARVQMMLGAPAADISYSKTYAAGHVETRGRIRLVNYRSTHPGTKAGNNPLSGMFTFDLSIPPNLDPPSMLYLQLQVPGTKTRILGQTDERGGWAIPTPPEGYISKYQNLERAHKYGKNHCRYMPIIASQVGDDWLAESRIYYSNYGNQAGSVNATDGIGYNFDPIPIDPSGNVGGTVNIVGGAAVNVRQIDNWEGNHVDRGSRMIRFKNAEHKRPRSDTNVSRGSEAFGCGKYRLSAVFTTSMIVPNWVWTSTENATIQTFDIQLLWGDTSNPVTGTEGHPVQFSIIASP